jgi:hypothetical protein
LAGSGSDGVEVVIGVAGYGNLGVASLAALPSSASTHLRRQPAAGKQQKQQRAAIIELETGRVDEDDEQESRPIRAKRVHREVRSEQPAATDICDSEVSSKPRRRKQAHHNSAAESDRAGRKRQPASDRSPPAEPDRARRKRKPASNARTLEQDPGDDSAMSGAPGQRKLERRPPLSLASLAASAAAVAVSGTGVSADNMRCVTVRIGGVEVQVPMLARGARAPSRPAKSASELETDMHSLVLGWDIAQAAESEDSDKCGIGHGGSGALKQVPVRFGSADEYEDSIAPLLMHECLQQVRFQQLIFSFKLREKDNPVHSCSLSQRSVSMFRIVPALALYVA